MIILFLNITYTKIKNIMKKCSKCKIEKEYSLFGVRKHQKMGILIFVKSVKF
jgi:hypothetical protein